MCGLRVTVPGRGYDALGVGTGLARGILEDRLAVPPMRIIVQTELYPPFISGESVFAGTIARGMAARGHDVAVLTSSTDGPPATAWPIKESTSPTGGAMHVTDCTCAR